MFHGVALKPHTSPQIMRVNTRPPLLKHLGQHPTFVFFEAPGREMSRRVTRAANRHASMTRRPTHKPPSYRMEYRPVNNEEHPRSRARGDGEFNGRLCSAKWEHCAEARRAADVERAKPLALAVAARTVELFVPFFLSLV